MTGHMNCWCFIVTIWPDKICMISCWSRTHSYCYMKVDMVDMTAQMNRLLSGDCVSVYSITTS